MFRIFRNILAIVNALAWMNFKIDSDMIKII